MTFLNVTVEGTVSLVNSNGFQLTSLLGQKDSHTASYPANGEMMILYNDSNSYYTFDTIYFTVEWECDEDTPVVPPAEGYDSSEYLTLAQSGMYERLFSQMMVYNWIIPCNGTLSIAERLGNLNYAQLHFINSNGSSVYYGGADTIFSSEYQVDGNFIVQLRRVYEDYKGNGADNFFYLSWSCNGARPPLPSFGETSSPPTPAPRTIAPLPACSETSSPLKAAFPSDIPYPMKCWTFQCKGTAHVTFLNVTVEGTVSLVNSNGFQLTSLLGQKDSYTASYPANGEMMILYNDSNSYYDFNTIYFTVEWECDEDTPVVPPAEGYDSSEYLTLAQSGMYERLFSQMMVYNWIIPCNGTLSIAERLGNLNYAQLHFINSNGSSVYYGGADTIFSSEYQVDGNFIVQLRRVYEDYKGNGADNFFYLSWSCNGARPPLPSFGETSSPPTPAPRTMTPLPACSETSSPLKAAFPSDIPYPMKCWTFQCKGTAHVTFLNVTVEGTVSLVNSNGFQLTSLLGQKDSYTASYPANGEMMILYNDSNSYYDFNTIYFTVEWECDEDTPVVPPAEGYDSSEYLTLAQSGMYERLFSQMMVYNWIIPCNGTLSIAERLGNLNYAQLHFINSNGSSVYYGGADTIFSSEYQVDGNFIVQLRRVYEDYKGNGADNFFYLSWSCNGVRPAFPGETSSPPTPAPRTMTPLPACSETSSPLNAAFPSDIPYPMKCWTFQCKGTVHVTFLNVTVEGTVSLVNSNGFQLTSLLGQKDSYTASYPANGEMMILYNDSNSYYDFDTIYFTVEWECDEDTPVVPPAEGYDSSEYLTLAQSGMYERLFSQMMVYNWIIPCNGTLSIAERIGNLNFAQLTFTNSNGRNVHDGCAAYTFSAEYEVDGNFIVQLRRVYEEYKGNGADNLFYLSWSCNGVRPAFAGETSSPPTPAPPTLVPLPSCSETSSPLKAAFPSDIPYPMKCWTFQCKGTAHVTFLNVTVEGTVSLVNSNGYELLSLMRDNESYSASYPANGEMMILYNDSNSHYYFNTIYFTVEWECDEDTPVVPPAEGYDPSEYLTLAQSGMYERLLIQGDVYNWIIPCNGTLSLVAEVGDVFYSTLRYVNSNGTTVLERFNPGRVSAEYRVDGIFLVQLTSQDYWWNDTYWENAISLSWNCDSVAPPTSAPATAIPTATPTDLPTGATFAPPTPAPGTALPTATPTDLPAGATFAPPTPAPGTALPTATPTDLPAGATFAPPTPAPGTALPTATPTDLPTGATFAPPTSAPGTALPTATPTDLPAGATFAPPPPPSVNALCTTDQDCRSGRLDPKATCNAGVCVCHAQGYSHPPGVPLCLLADDVTVPMGFAVEYGVGARSSWTTNATTKEDFVDTMGEALGTVTEIRVLVSDAGVLVVGMVRASTAKLADALSGKEDLTAALSSEGVSVSHGVTCARTDASYTVQHNGVCNAVECEGNTTLTLADGTYRCEREAPPQPDESGGSSKVFLYVGIAVGVLGVAVGVVVAFFFQQRKQRAQELEDPVLKVPFHEEAGVYSMEEKTLN